jgi:hypothetical protein
VGDAVQLGTASEGPYHHSGTGIGASLRFLRLLLFQDEVHRAMGPGLLASACERCLTRARTPMHFFLKQQAGANRPSTEEHEATPPVPDASPKRSTFCSYAASWFSASSAIGEDQPTRIPRCDSALGSLTQANLWRDCIVPDSIVYQWKRDMQMFRIAQASELAGSDVGVWCSRCEGICVTSPEPSPEANPVEMRAEVLWLDGLEKCHGSIWHSHKRTP